MKYRNTFGSVIGAFIEQLPENMEKAKEVQTKWLDEGKPKIDVGIGIASGESASVENCSNIVNAPKLNGTTLSESCYEGMFYNCINLKEAPDLHDANLAKNCYDYMYNKNYPSH